MRPEDSPTYKVSYCNCLSSIPIGSAVECDVELINIIDGVVMKKSVAAMACLALLGVITDAGSVDVPPDLILLHGRIHTEDSSRSVAQALAVRGNTIVAVGTDPAISSMAGPRSLDFMATQLERAFDAMHATGITSVQDASVDEHDMQIYKYLYDAHRLKMRVRASFTLKDLHEPAKIQIDRAIRFRSKWAIDPDFLRADAIKIFSDGVIEYPSQTAALLEPYLDADGHPTQNRGPTYVAQAQFDRIVSAADAAGFTVHVHAIGDRAVRSILDAFAASRRSNGMLDNRDQIAHLQLISPTDFPRFKELGVIANFQLLWATLDPTYIVKNTLPYIGSERSKYLYPARSLRDAGALIAGGSDWDVSSFDPFAAMERAITRSEGRGQGSLLPEQSITLQDIVDAYTINAAYALKQEHTTGSLESGKRGDFIVLDKDIFAIDPFDLHDTHVLMTYLDGHEVYAAKTR
jgi:predicted amidohydrolase YtcJ